MIVTTRTALLVVVCSSLLAVAAQEDGRRVSDACSTPLLFKVRSKAKFSGFGSLFEYYHFVVDWAPEIAHALRGFPACAPKPILVPGWMRDQRFSLVDARDPTRSMARHHEALFGQPLRVTIQRVRSAEELDAANVTRVLSSWNPHAKPWSAADAAIYAFFRSFCWSLLAATGDGSSSSSSSGGGGGGGGGAGGGTWP